MRQCDKKFVCFGKYMYICTVRYSGHNPRTKTVITKHKPIRISMKKILCLATIVSMVAVSVLFSGCEDVINPPIDDTDTTDTIKPDTTAISYPVTWLVGNCRRSDLDAEAIMFDAPTTYTVASKLTNLKLKEGGNRIVAIRAFVADDATDVTVFAGTDYNNPAVVVNHTFEKGGWQYVMLDKPIDIADADLYIGYTTTSKLVYVETSRKILKDELLKTDGGFESIYDKHGKYALKLQVAMTGGGQEATTDLAIDNIHATQYAIAGEAVGVGIEIRNEGNITLENPEVKTSFGGQTVNATYSGKLHSGQSAIVPINGYTATEKAQLKASIAVANDADSRNNELQLDIRVYSDRGVPRNSIAVEHFTGQGCTYCPGGAKALSTAIAMMDEPERVAWISNHTFGEDDFALAEGYEIYDILGNQGAPMICVNRLPVTPNCLAGEILVWNPTLASAELLNSLLGEPGYATLDMKREYDAATRQLTVTISGKSLRPEAYYTAIVTQSGIIAEQGGASSEYEHKHATRAYLTPSDGTPLTLDADGNYSATISYTIPDKVGIFPCQPEDMEVVVMIHGKLADAASRIVYNTDHKAVVE